MYTRCPECETTFKLGVADLRRAQGKVRCGDCQFVFNALEYLAEDLADETQDQLPVLDNPVEQDSTVELVRAGYLTDQDGPNTDRPPPMHGEHTDEILLELGYDEDAISALRSEQVI